LPIADRYAELAAAEGAERHVHERIMHDFEAGEQALRAITEAEDLLAGEPVIRASIERRNPHTDVLNLVQLERLRRLRRNGEEKTLEEAVFASINGVAAAMQNTG
jgi:phosphoenolpyruvate carboxylase